MNGVSLGKLMDSLGVRSFKKAQLDIIDNNEKVFKVILYVEYVFIILYILSCIYLFINTNSTIYKLNGIFLVCWVVLSIVGLFETKILKYRLSRNMNIK